MNPLEEDERLSRRGFLVGTAGVAAMAGASGSALAQEDNESDDGEGGGQEGEDGDGEGDEGGEDGEGEGDGGGGETVEVSVVDNEFDPAGVTIEPGSTVRWIWEGENNHNVNPTEQPGDADWAGQQELQSDGEYEHTFDVEGDYHYVCDPHVGLGMEGDITVSTGGGGGGGPVQLVPDAAMTLLVATVAGMVSTLSLVYAFMRYGGPTGE